MCIIFIAWRVHPKHQVLVIGNRDEFYDRETRQAYEWEDHTHIVGGRDQRRNGSWMAVSKKGRFAAITNVRLPFDQLEKDKKSRGDLVVAFLDSNQDPLTWCTELQKKATDYGQFNLLVGTTEQLLWYSNQPGNPGPKLLQPGYYVLSNASLDTPWPKAVKGKRMLVKVLSEPDFDLHKDIDKLWAILADTEAPTPETLPDTGVGIEWESVLGPICVHTAEKAYGTRQSWIVSLVPDCSKWELWERTVDGRVEEMTNRDVHLEVRIEPPGTSKEPDRKKQKKEQKQDKSNGV